MENKAYHCQNSSKFQ